MASSGDSWDDQPIDEGPGEHDAHLMDDDLSETTPCARCGKDIWVYAQRCNHCGVHFSGEAWQFAPPGEAKAPASGRWWRWVAALAAAALLVWILN